MAPVEEASGEPAEAELAPTVAIPPPQRLGSVADKDVEDWVNNVDEVSSQIHSILDGTIVDFDEFDRKLALKDRAKQIREEEARERRERYFLYGVESKGEGRQYKWWCKRCFVEYAIDLPGNACTRCKQPDKMMTQQARRDELMGKLDSFKETKNKHQWRKDKWLRWKKSQALLGKSRNINYKAWEYWEPDTDSEDEGEPIVPRDNPEFLAMEADMKSRRKKAVDRAGTAEKFRQRGNRCMRESDFVGAIEQYEEGLEYRRDCKALWTNKALAELKVFRWRDAIESCNKVIEYAEIFEDGFDKSADACFKAFMRRATALRALHMWSEAVADLEEALQLFPSDKEARDMLEKTRAADKEALGLRDGATVAAGPASASPPGPVRVEIEESEDEEDADALRAAPAHAGSLAGLSKPEFASLASRLRLDQGERAAFCARERGSCRTDGHKIKLPAAEEVTGPSGLDGVLRDAERCCILWKKAQARATEQLDADAAEEEQEAAFLRVVAPRALGILRLLLASGSEHHCALTAAAVRHVWPLLPCAAWRQTTLELLRGWSMHSLSARAMAEFAGRYPESLRLLTAAAAGDVPGPLPVERALGLGTAPAAQPLEVPVELALSALGNICLAGHLLPAFRDAAVPLLEALAPTLATHIGARQLRARAAAAVSSAVRLGEGPARAAEEHCLRPLCVALAEGGAAPELLAALVNLLVLRPAAAERALELGVLEPALALVDPEAPPPAAEEGPEATDAADATVTDPTALVSHRAVQVVARILSRTPGALAPLQEAKLLAKLRAPIERAGAVLPTAGGGLERLELALRMLTVLLTRTPGFLGRLCEGETLVHLGPALVSLAVAAEPVEHVGPAGGGAASRLRGNLALALGTLCEAQQQGARPALERLDLAPVVPALVGCLRKERGGAQKNAGVCVTKLAQSARYRQLVRDLSGIESLHQIHLPTVEAQKADAMWKHKIETSASTRKAETKKRLEAKALRDMD
eukprot:CAMPEP_0168388320 /NCGR_PEP_ID=MMETSP0228-20121227/16392_1 /TAXON_ID=133427 /ORGANISM="Protoceratium reticulatum, Strain CCCM 535 (=CCMP 1889)" /LENGTH=988 /DNA_ID=CAMNT_0008401567 /DNA_START=24 /DNA_END=2990 /DNA_ORIENTATION=+